LPAVVVGSLLSAPDDDMQMLAQWAGDFVRCIAPTANAAHLARGKMAAGHLLAMFHRVLAEAQDGDGHGLLIRLAGEAQRVGRSDRDVIVANGIGFLSQTYEATAGLIGNTLVALARHDDV